MWMICSKPFFIYGSCYLSKYLMVKELSHEASHDNFLFMKSALWCHAVITIIPEWIPIGHICKIIFCFCALSLSILERSSIVDIKGAKEAWRFERPPYQTLWEEVLPWCSVQGVGLKVVRLLVQTQAFCTSGNSRFITIPMARPTISMQKEMKPCFIKHLRVGLLPAYFIDFISISAFQMTLAGN